eukprot:268321-Prymnesium_polylepis.1
MTRTLLVIVESDTRVRLIGDCKNFKNEFLGVSNGWSWQGGRFNGRPPHWVWGVRRGDTPGGLDASILLVGQLLNNNHIDKVEIDYTKQLDTETTLATPSKRTSYVDTETAQSKHDDSSFCPYSLNMH